jgi:hypothetical protein|eukprot:7763965-Prorocentrum_lima.AAC.1
MEGTMVGILVGTADTEGASLSARDGHSDFDGDPVGKILGSVEVVGRLEGRPDGSKAGDIDGWSVWEGL